MRFKPVPEPPADLAFVETVHRALPAAAGDVDDCCAHLLEETPIADRDEAATWLTFLRALELAVEESGSFRRREVDSSGDADAPSGLARAFRDRVDGADAVCTALEKADESLTVTEVVERLRDDRSSDDQRSRRGRTDPERTERLLEWTVLFGLAERADDGYRVALTRE